jgi:hypothetical protein
MKKSLISMLVTGILAAVPVFADTITPEQVYDHMKSVFVGEWSLSPADKQIDTTGAHKHKAVAPLVGTDATGIAFKVIGRGATLQEDLLPDTMKQMVTMYHCDDYIDCNQLLATHYCAKQNQPQFILNTKETTKNRIVFDCNMETKLCKSDEDHIHKIIHELSKDGRHLKSSYLGWTDQKPNKKNSIYHFDRKK